MSYAGRVLADGPVGFWRLNEKAGVNAADASGNAFTGTYTGGPTLGVASPIVSDSGASAITVDGATQYVFLPAVLTLETIAPMSVEVWVKTTQAGVGTIFGSQDTNNHGWNLDVGVTAAGHASFWDHTAWRAGPLLNDGNWHHVVVTDDGALVKFYVDGVLLSTVAGVSPDQMGFRDNHALGALANHAFNGGPLQTNNFYAGSLAECALYATVLSAAAVKAHYDAAKLRAGWGQPI